jgi:hypothetical protein
LGTDAPKKLLPLMNDDKLEVRRGVAFHLLSSFDPASPEQVAAFTKALDDNDATVRGIGLQAVRQMSAADRDAANGYLLAMLDPQAEPEPKTEQRSLALPAAWRKKASPLPVPFPKRR